MTVAPQTSEEQSEVRMSEAAANSSWILSEKRPFDPALSGVLAETARTVPRM